MLTELRTLVAIARYGTFSGTGEKIGLTQAAVSGQMKRLETQLGFPLFDRTGRSAILNSAGARTVELARPILEAVAALSDPTNDALARPIRVGAIASVQPTIVTQALRLFRADFGNVQVHIVPGVSIHLLDQIDAGDLDIAVIIQPPFGLSPDFEWQSLCSEPYMLLAPSGFGGATCLHLLETMPLLRYDRGSFGGRQVDRFLRTLPMPVDDAVEVDDLSAMMAMVRNGLGVAIAPISSALLPLPEGVCAIALPKQSMVREIGFIRADRPWNAAPLRYFAECLVEAGKLFGGDASRA